MVCSCRHCLCQSGIVFQQLLLAVAEQSSGTDEAIQLQTLHRAGTKTLAEPQVEDVLFEELDAVLLTKLADTDLIVVLASFAKAPQFFQWKV